MGDPRRSREIEGLIPLSRQWAAQTAFAGDGMFAAVLDAAEELHRRKAEPVGPLEPKG